MRDGSLLPLARCGATKQSLAKGMGGEERTEAGAAGNGAGEARRLRETRPGFEARLAGAPLEALVKVLHGAVTLQVGDIRAVEAERVEFRLRDGEWRPLALEGGIWAAKFDTAKLSDGYHRLEVRVVTSTGQTMTKSTVVEVGNLWM